MVTLRGNKNVDSYEGTWLKLKGWALSVDRE
jgi:hypothetical protein